LAQGTISDGAVSGPQGAATGTGWSAYNLLSEFQSSLY